MGWTLSTATSAAPSLATRIGSSLRRIDSSAAIGMSTRRRSGHFLDRCTRLFCILETARSSVVQRQKPRRQVEIPAAVGVDPDMPSRAEDGLARPPSGLVVGRRPGRRF